MKILIFRVKIRIIISTLLITTLNKIIAKTPSLTSKINNNKCFLLTILSKLRPIKIIRQIIAFNLTLIIQIGHLKVLLLFKAALKDCLIEIINQN